MDDGARPAGGRKANQPRVVDALVVGAGFGGMYMVHRLREMGVSVLGIEAGGDVGGVWYWNRYPGARCDVQSIDYSYSFSEEIQQDWTWPEQFSAQPQILAYASFVADKLDLRRDFQFNTRVTSAAFDDARAVWVACTDNGDVIEATYCIMATGPLSIPKENDIEGAETFEGELYRAAKWPHHPVSFVGKRVGVIGVGSSGIQIIPVVAKEAAELVVFQRTPSFTIPMRNRLLEPEYVAQVKAHYPTIRAAARSTYTGGVRPISTRPLFSMPVEEREYLMEDAWERGANAFMGLFSDLLINEDANAIVADFVRAKIGEVVEDPVTAEQLKPRGYPIFARRPGIDTNYYETYNLPNVRLIDCVQQPIMRFTQKGIKTTTEEIQLDAVILATGYDALTGALLALDIRGREGRDLREKWKDGPRSYLGIAIEGFPNFFVVGGPNSPSALAAYIPLNESHVQWIAECIEYMRTNKFGRIEAQCQAEDRWMETLRKQADGSLMPKANTWYTGTNIAGKPRQFPIYIAGLHRYRDACQSVAEEGYRGFTLELEF